MKARDNAGVKIPPPMIYAAFFGLASLMQSIFPISFKAMESRDFHFAGWLLILGTLIITLPGLWRFWHSKNTLITVKPASSLQTTGIYSFTRNPMYLGLLLLYAGLSCFSGNCWTLVFLPLVFMVIQNYVIRREEKYLDRAFAEEYREYRNKTRRWI